MEKLELIMTSYFSVDVETTGTVPGYHSLLSVGAVEIESGDTFHRIMACVDSHTNSLTWDASTMEWWNSNEQEQARLRLRALLGETNRLIDYGILMLNAAEDFFHWVNEYPGEHIFVGWPASFDYPFVQHLFLKSGYTSPFSHRTFDIKSFAAGKFNVEIEASRDALPDFMS